MYLTRKTLLFAKIYLYLIIIFLLVLAHGSPGSTHVSCDPGLLWLVSDQVGSGRLRVGSLAGRVRSQVPVLSIKYFLILILKLFVNCPLKILLNFYYLFKMFQLTTPYDE